MATMKAYTLERTGDVPVRFVGDLLAEVTTRNIAGQERNRWYEVQLFRTEAGRHVLRIAFRTCWQGEHHTSRVYLCDTPEDVRAEVRAYDPLRDVGGYPAGDAYREKQARLEHTLRLDWGEAVSELFGGHPEEFTEVIA